MLDGNVSNKFTLLLILSLAVSCADAAKDSASSIKLEQYELIGKYPCEEFGEVLESIYYNGFLIASVHGAKKKFRIINLSSGDVIYSWGDLGRGPGEYLRIGRQLSIRDSLLFFSDSGAKKLYALNLNSLLNTEDFKTTECTYPYTRDFRPNKLMALDNMIICLGAINDLRFGILDRSTLDIIPHSNQYMPHSKNIQNMYVGSVYQSLMQSNPGGGEFVVSLLSSDYFEIYDTAEKEVHCIYEKSDATMPVLHKKPKLGIEYSIDYDKSIAGNVGLTTTNDRVLFLFSDDSYTDYAAKDEASMIKCFNWAGELKEQFVLPFPVSNIAANEDYLFCFKNEGDHIALYSIPVCSK